MPQLIKNKVNEEGLTESQTSDISLYLFHQCSRSLFAHAQNDIEDTLLYEFYYQLRTFEVAISEIFKRIEMYERYGVGMYNTANKFSSMIERKLNHHFDHFINMDVDEIYVYFFHIMNQLSDTPSS